MEASFHSNLTLLTLTLSCLPIMNPQTPKEFILEAFADPASVRDVVKGMSCHVHAMSSPPPPLFPPSSATPLSVAIQFLVV